MPRCFSSCGTNTSCLNATRTQLSFVAAWTTSNASVLSVCAPLLPLLNDLSASIMAVNGIVGQMLGKVLLAELQYADHIRTLISFAPIPWAMSPVIFKAHVSVASNLLLQVACGCQLTAQSLCAAF